MKSKEDDAKQLIDLTNKLYHHIYDKCMESRGVEEVSRLLEGAIELPGDELRIQIWELEEKVEEERNRAEEERIRAEKMKEEMQEEIEKLRQELKSLQEEKSNR